MERLKAVSFFTDAEAEVEDKDGNAYERRPWLSRDLGADILNAVLFGQYGTRGEKIECKVDKLKDSADFAGDSLMCEFAYVLDLDKQVLEVYTGFNREPLKEGDRFFAVTIDDDEHNLKREGGPYTQVKLAATYPLDKLPTVEQMEADVEKEEVED